MDVEDLVKSYFSLKWRPVVDSTDIDGYICVLFEEDMLFLKRL
ncbi:Myosin-binding protein C, cardiac-type [Labeo rohita]|uniref:Myosin-binding protein C, cardiac-type n=1 Tax=Labeo rohita TaxID=84645 RepID=A0ABQ8MMT8_LABRO|nr:Myosin-binding protein C, cardiac-type [Labeo rohita]